MSNHKRSLCFRVENICANGVAVGKMLIPENIPREFLNRYERDVSRGIYIRKCYEDLYEEASAIMVNPKKVDAKFLFTGVPGIGKSMFMIYFLWRYSNDDRFKDKSFAFEVERSGYFYFQQSKEQGEFFCSGNLININQIRLSQILLVADMKEHREPATPGKWTLIFSSPNPLRYKETMKYKPRYRYILPTWSMEEIRMVDPDEKNWSPLYEKCGGVIRQLLTDESDSVDTVEEALIAKGPTIAQYFFKYGFGGLDPETNSALIHINPPHSAEKGGYLYRAPPVYSFASNYVLEQLAYKYAS